MNFIAAAALLFFIFHNKDLGATTKKVTFENEQGQTVQRVIPKSAFRKKIALFFFDNAAGDSTLDWLTYGITKALAYDLMQDIYLDGGYNYSTQWQQAGFPGGVGLPFTPKLAIACNAHRDYLLSGNCNVQKSVGNLPELDGAALAHGPVLQVDA